VGVLLCAAVLRAGIEAGTLAALALRPGHAGALRQGLERLALAALYLGLPAWLALRLLG
jgi:apolipoprotein N-acyltransferase